MWEGNSSVPVSSLICTCLFYYWACKYTPGSVINHGFIKRSSTRIWPGPCRHHKSFMSVFTRAKQTLWTRCTIIIRWRHRKPQTPNRVNSIPIVTRIRSRASPLSTSSGNSSVPVSSLICTCLFYYWACKYTPGSVINHGFIKRSSTRIWPGPCRHHKSFMSVFTRAKQTLWTRCTIIIRWRHRKPQTPNRVNSIPIVTRIRSRASLLSASSLAPLTSLLITS